MKLDILVFAAHPDDAELGCSGTIMKQIALGNRVGIVDLTEGELGSRGSAELRKVEAANSGKILGLSARENLNLGDGFFEINKSNQLKIVKTIRKYRPDVVLCNAPKDRHPDHGRGSELVSRACFLSGLVKIEVEGMTPWRPRAVYHYIQDRYLKPDFSVDITDYWDRKVQSIQAFSSQFYNPDSTEPHTPISTPEFMQFLEARAMQFGRDINVKYAEGFVVERTIGVEDITTLL